MATDPATDPTPRPLGPEVRAEPPTSGGPWPEGGWACERQIIPLAGGGFVAIWTSDDGDGGGGGVHGRLHDPSGTPEGEAFRIAAAAAGVEPMLPAAAGLADGGFVVAWTAWYGGGSGIHARRFDRTGAAAGGEFRVDAHASRDQQSPAVAGLAEGGFVVAWMSWRPDGGGYDVYVRRFDRTGVAAGGEFRVEGTGAESQVYPSVAGLAEGGFVVSWEAWRRDCGGFDLRSRRFDATGRPAPRRAGGADRGAVLGEGPADAAPPPPRRR